MPVKYNWSSNITFLLVVLLLAGLFISRALVSVTSIALIIPFALAKDGWFKISYVVLGCTLVILPALLSGIWSDDVYNWWRSVEVKLPLLTVGLALATVPLSFAKWQWIIWLLLLSTVAGSIWSMYKFAINPDDILAGYLRAKVIPTPLDNDHIRFSWLVVLVIILSLTTISKSTQNVVKIGLYFLVAWVVIYLHVLAAKTGLLCLYVAGIIYILDQIVKSKNWVKGFVLIAGFALIPVVAYLSMPSLRNRVQYIVYEFENYSKGTFIPGSSDGARVLSIKAGWQILKEHPLAGVGFGDLKQAMESWHQTYYPQSYPTDRFLPLDEWVLYGAASGWIGLFSFTTGILLLLKTAWSKHIVSKILCVVLIIPLITDDTLESQFGVVIFIFVLMVTRQLFKLPEPLTG